MSAIWSEYFSVISLFCLLFVPFLSISSPLSLPSQLVSTIVRAATAVHQQRPHLIKHSTIINYSSPITINNRLYQMSVLHKIHHSYSSFEYVLFPFWNKSDLVRYKSGWRDRYWGEIQKCTYTFQLEAFWHFAVCGCCCVICYFYCCFFFNSYLFIFLNGNLVRPQYVRTVMIRTHTAKCSHLLLLLVVLLMRVLY